MNKKITDMEILKVYIIPFLLVFVVLALNEYRLYRIGSVDYDSMVNAIAMLFISLASFILVQVILKIYG